MTEKGRGAFLSQVIAAATAGHYAVGYELNLWLVLWSRVRALYHGVNRQTEFHRQDLWKVYALLMHYFWFYLHAPPQVNLAQYDTVIIFGVNEMVCTVLEILLLTYTLCYPVDASARGEAHCKH